MLAALTTWGVLASMTIESPTEGDVFLAFVQQVLAPKLQSGVPSRGIPIMRARSFGVDSHVSCRAPLALQTDDMWAQTFF